MSELLLISYAESVFIKEQVSHNITIGNCVHQSEHDVFTNTLIVVFSSQNMYSF